ncbi:hypothetical protein AQUCO_00200490v1 [Aquilegia coerulea]|uniref:Protein CLP1 homolog n=1 Tax=Aquilegia coerulea TaxID=218851 RepID=A0A2G5F3N3_AQUCA|nr:hypothetical protein AQUCO_00200490v1 [Aquilegia coerulea]
MAYSGPIGAGAMVAANSSTTVRQVVLEKECELRIEVAETPLKLRLLSGTAEIYGTELPPEIWLNIPPNLKFAVFTWYGATIEMDGATETDYTADETPMISYVNVHAVLEGRRNRAKANATQEPDSSQGPRVIVVGPTDSGKSTLSRMLLSWAAKQGWKPTFVDLDIGQGAITIPGCVAATPIEMPIDPVEGIPLEMPLVFYYGHTTPSVNADLYKMLVKELAGTLERQFSGNAEARAAGMVINTMGWIEGVGYEVIVKKFHFLLIWILLVHVDSSFNGSFFLFFLQLLLHAIDTFNADVVLVIGQVNVMFPLISMN